MPNCVVKGCINHTSRDKKQYGITFHIFPNRDQNHKEKWIAAIRDSRKEPSWQPTSRSVVCSAHFNSDDLYYTNKGLRRVVKTGYPKILPNVIEEFVNVDLSQPPSVQEECSLPDLSNDLKLSQSSSSCAILPNVIEEFVNVDLSQPPSVQEECSLPDLSNDLKLSQSSSSCAVPAVQSDSSIFDTPRKRELPKGVLLLQQTLKINERKIKTLNQKVRRLHKRNESLRKILNNLKKQNKEEKIG